MQSSLPHSHLPAPKQLLDTLRREDDKTSVLRLFHEPSLGSYEAFREGRVEEALIFVREMANKGFCPDHLTFNTLISGLCKVGHVNHAMEILELMLQEGFDPDVFTYNTVISGLCKTGEVEEAMEFLNQMLSRDCVLPDVSTFNSLIQGLWLTSRFSVAVKLFFLSYFCKEGDIKRAADIVQKMTSNWCEPDIVTHRTLTQGRCKAGRTEVATRLCALNMEETLIKLIDKVVEKAKFSGNEAMSYHVLAKLTGIILKLNNAMLPQLP
ncbi:hypothetical protein BUALT_Bualt09G0113400 [Buddleja alternifolia]|uniref:Pentatricopeptide repeat-containing protein n=1 Tax=Buddleja alternifolia TaxID=168488 RepID=A0AAV6X284_9LAMI|nr:hypothetical protein BUALT_Bualt09G0113400 [Buddleja alternifolia]